MVNHLLTSTIIVLVQAPSTFGWIPRILTSCSGLRNSSSGVDARKNSVLLSASNAHGDEEIDDDSDHSVGKDSDINSLPLFAEERQLPDYISRLEAMYDIDTDATDFFTDIPDGNGKSQPLLEGGERVVLGDWMEWEEGPCYGDSCGDDSDQCDIPEEFKVAVPKVDVMSFLGIRRAEPLQVARDWD